MKIIVRDLKVTKQKDLNNNKEGPWKFYESEETSFEWCVNIFLTIT